MCSSSSNHNLHFPYKRVLKAHIATLCTITRRVAMGGMWTFRGRSCNDGLFLLTTFETSRCCMTRCFFYSNRSAPFFTFSQIHHDACQRARRLKCDTRGVSHVMVPIREPPCRRNEILRSFGLDHQQESAQAESNHPEPLYIYTRIPIYVRRRKEAAHRFQCRRTSRLHATE